VSVWGPARVAEIREETMFIEIVVVETVEVVVAVLFKSLCKISWSDNITIFIKYLCLKKRIK